MTRTAIQVDKTRKTFHKFAASSNAVASTITEIGRSVRQAPSDLAKALLVEYLKVERPEYIKEFVEVILNGNQSAYI